MKVFVYAYQSRHPTQEHDSAEWMVGLGTVPGYWPNYAEVVAAKQRDGSYIDGAEVELAVPCIVHFRGDP